MSHRALSPDEFHGKLTDPEGWGGYSANPHTGAEPESGYMVSRWGHEEQVPGTAQPEDIGGYLERHGEHMRDPSSYHGAWQSEGTTFLDESVNIEGRREAMDYGREHAQRAVFNLDQMSEHAVPAKPRQTIRGTLFEHLPKGQRNRIGEGHRTAQRQQRELQLERQGGMEPPEETKQRKGYTDTPMF